MIYAHPNIKFNLNCNDVPKIHLIFFLFFLAFTICESEALQIVNMRWRYELFFNSLRFFFRLKIHVLVAVMQSVFSIMNRWLAYFRRNNNRGSYTHTHSSHTVCRKWCAWMQRRISIFFFLSLRSLKTAFGCDIWDESIYECVRIRIWKHQKFKKYFCSVSPYSAIFMLVWFKRFSKCCFCFFFLFMTCSRLSSLKNTQLHLISQIHTERDRAN